MHDSVIHWDPFAKEQPALGEVVIAIGVFDGMHLGHRALFAMARQEASVLGVSTAAVTFDRDPDEIFRRAGDPLDKLLSNADRLRMISEQVDGAVLSLPATQQVFGLEPDAFLSHLAQVMTPRAVFTGADFRFGRRASGTVADIERWAAGHACTCVPCELIEEKAAPVTATRIRQLLCQGDVSEARDLLAGRAHSVTGRVVHGRGEGEDFGFATANLDLAQNETMLPLEGVYAAYAFVDGQSYAAAVNVGVAKSFEGATAQLEAHLLDFEGDLYGKDVRIEFVQWLREPRVFASTDELIETVMGNIDWVRKHLGGGLDGAHL